MVFDDDGGAVPSAFGTADRTLPRSFPKAPKGAPGVRRQTIKNAISCSGVGLHCGQRVSMTLHPAPARTGVVFRRSHGGAVAEIPALWTHVKDSRLCTVIGDDAGTTVATIEHLMAALAAMGVDDVLIEIDGPEVPAMDGSAAPFVFLIDCAGLVALDAPRTALRVLEPVTVRHATAEATLVPAAAGLTIDFEIEFAAAAIGRQACSLAVTPSVFKEEISRARTFGLIEDLPKMREAGLALGGSLDNAVVVNGAEILNEDGLRYPDEFVRHKMLDAVGDLALAGRPLIGRYTGRRSSHALNTTLLQTLFARPSAWTEVPLGAPENDEPAPLLRATA